jgi:hypothetical protein
VRPGDVSVSDTIGRSAGSNLVRIGSSISGGSSFRIAEISSRISCVACCSSFSKTNWTITVPKLSSEDELIWSTPLMPEMASSIRSMTSRSTVSGEAPGYGIAMAITGGCTSGNSSVSSCVRATIPNTTSASIVTTVMTGRLMAKSDMSMRYFAGCGVLTATGVPGEMAWADPRSRTSLSFTPCVICTRSVRRSRRPSATSTFCVFPSVTRRTQPVDSPVSRTAFDGTTRPVAD